MKHITWAYRQNAVDEWNPPDRDGDPSPAVQKLILYVLNSFAGNQCDCFPSIKTLATRSCASESTVRRALEAMEQSKVVTAVSRRRPDGSSTSNTYIILYKNLCSQKIPDDCSDDFQPQDECKKQQCLVSEGVSVGHPGVSDRQGEGVCVTPHITIQSNHPDNHENSRVEKSDATGGKSGFADRKKVEEIPLPKILDTPEFHVAWGAWKKYKRETVKKLTPSSVSRQYAFLEKLGVSRAILAIDYSISQGYMGLYEPSGQPVTQQRQLPKFIPPNERKKGV